MHSPAGDAKVNKEVHRPPGALKLAVEGRMNNCLTRPSGHHGGRSADFDHFKIKMNPSDRGAWGLEVFSPKSFQPSYPRQEIGGFLLLLLMAAFTSKIHLKESLLKPLRKSLTFKFNSWAMRPGRPDSEILSEFHYLKAGH